MQSLQGKTVLITGASSGIGRALALEVAAQGARLVLLARSETPLVQLAVELSAKGFEPPVFVMQDLGDSDCASRVHAHLDSLNISVDVLVNNAGFGSYGAFETLNAKTERQQIAVNVAAVVDLCHAFIPGMLSRGSGIVLNIASTAAFQPAPYMAVYAATKAFVLSFSEALWAEYRERGVHVVALCPGPVETAFIDKLDHPGVRKTSVFASTTTADQVARQAVQAMLFSAPSRIVGFKHWIMANSIRLVPRALVARSAAGMLKPTDA